MFSTFFMHLAALLRQALLPLLVIIFEPATAATVPTARPIPMLLNISVLFDDANKAIPPIKINHYYFVS